MGSQWMKWCTWATGFRESPAENGMTWRWVGVSYRAAMGDARWWSVAVDHWIDFSCYWFCYRIGYLMKWTRLWMGDSWEEMGNRLIGLVTTQFSDLSLDDGRQSPFASMLFNHCRFLFISVTFCAELITTVELKEKNNAPLFCLFTGGTAVSVVWLRPSPEWK